jgi:hypothetical protein
VTSGTVSTLAGRFGVSAPFQDGTGSVATFYCPTGVAMDARGVFAVVVSAQRGVHGMMQVPSSPPLQTDTFNKLLRSIAISTGAVTTLAGRRGVAVPFFDGVGSAATFSSPSGVALNAAATLALVVSTTHVYKHTHARTQTYSPRGWKGGLRGGSECTQLVVGTILVHV